MDSQSQAVERTKEENPTEYMSVNVCQKRGVLYGNYCENGTLRG